MPAYIVRNGQLQIRQKDFNIPNYRIIPYKSSVNPTHNDYITSTIDEFQKQIHKANQDYRSLIQAMWKAFSHIDRTSYDPQIMFLGLKSDEIYDKISLIRGVNPFEAEEESLRLSAIMKIDDNTPLYHIDSSEVSPARSKLRDQIKHDSLYEIQEEEECMSTSSQQQRQRKQSSNGQNSSKEHQKQKAPSPKGCHRLSLQNITGHKRESSRGSRSSLLIRQKISLAFHEQQELRQLLQEQLQKITQELDEKTEYLNWTVQELRARNELIERLKETIWRRDEALEIHEQKINSRERDFDSSKYQVIVDEKDREIGLLINSLIERTQDTGEDVQFLKKSIQGSLSKAQNETQTREQEEDRKVEQSIYLEDLQSSAGDQISDKIAKSPTLPLKSGDSRSESLEHSALRPKKMNFDSPENITYLTKEHFLLAEKNYQNLLIPNVKMTQSIRPDSRGKSPNRSP